MASIDMDKVKKVFDHLAETKPGHESLIGFRQSIETLRNGIPSALNLNNHEFLELAQRLVMEMKADDLTPKTAAGGALSDAELKNVAGGVRSAQFSVASVQRLGPIRAIGNLGFNIATVN